MSRIEPSYEEVLDALCNALVHIDRSRYAGDKAFWAGEAVATRAGRSVDVPECSDRGAMT